MEFGIRQNKINVKEATKVTLNHGTTNGTREQEIVYFCVLKELILFNIFKLFRCVILKNN